MTTKGIIGKKIGMTRIFGANGDIVPVTLLEVENNQVTKILTPERDGYHGYQVGFCATKEHRLNRPDLHRLRKSGIDDNFSQFHEFRTSGAQEGISLGARLTAQLFEGVSSVDVTGFTKGRGFQGAVKRNGTHIGRMSHGSRHHRRPGSLGCRTTPGRVMKNKAMPGHMGTEQRTTSNLKVVLVDTEANVIAIKGAVPGHRGGYVFIEPSIKA